VTVTRSGEIVVTSITQPAQGVVETAILAADTVTLPAEAITEATTPGGDGNDVAASRVPPPSVFAGFCRLAKQLL